MITAERLRALVNYDRETGAFTARGTRGRCDRWKDGRELGWIMANGYRSLHVMGEQHLAHRLAWLYVHGRWPDRNIDHVNMDRLDNRIANLRECDQSQNMANVGPKVTNTSGFKGVTKHFVPGKWKAQIMRNRKQLHLGIFQSREAAAEAYAAAARSMVGEFARTTAPGVP